MSKRNDLLKKYHVAKNGPEKEAIQAQILALDIAASKDLPLELLDVPRDKLKGLLSGDESIWYEKPEGMPVELWAASQVAGDLLLDPLNVVGGSMAKGGKAVKGAISSLGNYIPNWYGPGKPINPDGMLSAQGQAGLQKATGLGGWLVDNVRSVGEHVFSPQSRGLFEEYGTNIPSQRRMTEYADLEDQRKAFNAEKKSERAAVKEQLDAGELSKEAHKEQLKEIDAKKFKETRADAKITGEFQYQGHIGKQSGHEGTKGMTPEAAEIQRRSYMQEYTPVSQENMEDALKSFPTEVNGREVYVSDKEAEIFAGYGQSLKNVVGRPLNEGDSFVVKNPRSANTGAHHQDVVQTNPANAALGEAWEKFADKDGNVNIEQLYGWLKQNKDKYNEKLDPMLPVGKKKNQWDLFSGDIERVRKNGLWLTGGRVGSAVTEGGVSWLMKIEPDGTMKVMMRDLHDFAEKVPGVGKIAAVNLPNQVVAVSPVMVNNIKSIKKGITTTAKDAEGNVIKERTGASLKSGEKRLQQQKVTHSGPDYQHPAAPGGELAGETYSDLARGHAARKASPEAQRRAVRQMSGEGLLAERLYSNTRAEDTP